MNIATLADADRPSSSELLAAPKLMAWKKAGEFLSYGPQEHTVFAKIVGKREATADRTLLLLHGFPESSYSYHAVLESLQTRFDRIILFDMIGYGFSAKPEREYSYSLLEQADLALSVWLHFGVTGGHLLAHDMGTSVATELLARHELNLLPSFFSEGLQSCTFTNGSLVMAYSKLRPAQRILLSPRFGKSFGRLVNYKIFAHQVKSAHGNDRLSDQEIRDLWTLNALDNGHRKSYLAIKYINDRYQFEHNRWLPALRRTNLPIHLCWGDADQVARIDMAHHLKDRIVPQAVLTIMPGLGHFGQLGSPEEWAACVLKFYNEL